MVNMSDLTVPMLVIAQFVLGFPVMSQSTDLNFLVLGDWGGTPVYPYHTSINTRVAEAMNFEAKHRNTQFQIGLGDNFYFFGVKDVNDKRFQETFENVYNGGSLQTDWYHIAGNHDYFGNISAQIAYTKISKRWNYPDYYYTKIFHSPDGATVQLVMIDTMILCGIVWDDYGSPKPFVKEEVAEEHWVWIQNILANSSADYLIVGGHFPVYSVASHGPTATLVHRLRPLLFKYNVTAYVSGHDHTLQHLKEVSPSGQRMDYMVIGTATKVEDSHWHEKDVPAGALKFYNADKAGGFAAVSLNKKYLTLTFISGSNKELYQTVLQSRRVSK